MGNAISKIEMKRADVYRMGVALIASVVLTGISSGQNINDLMLKNYRPVSIYKVPVTNIVKAKYPAIDMHTHSSYAQNDQAIVRWIKDMDACGIEKVIVFTD